MFASCSPAADVLTIENSRSDNEMIRALAEFGYSCDIGPGVYDVHSPLVPSTEFIGDKLRSFQRTGVLNGDVHRLHANPDCGLKTRRWKEVIPALRNLVEAARIVRAEVGGGEQAAACAGGEGPACAEGQRCC